MDGVDAGLPWCDGPVSPHVPDDGWAQRLAHRGRLGPGTLLLDVGCGAGQLARAIEGVSGCLAAGIDRSPEQFPLERGRTLWLAADAACLPVADSRADAILLSHLLHLMPDPLRALQEAHRVLRPDGTLLIRLASHAQLQDRPELQAFPRALNAALESIPDTVRVVAALQRLGFVGIIAEEVLEPRAPSRRTLLARPLLDWLGPVIVTTPAEFARGQEWLLAWENESPEAAVMERLTLVSATR